MSPLVRKYKKEYAVELLAIGEGDFESAKILAFAKQGRKENALFLMQQAIEKALKAVLVHKTGGFPHTHDLDVLVHGLSEPLFHEAPLLTQFNQYSGVRRYERGFEELSDEDLKMALNVCEKVLLWSKQQMSGSS